MSESPSFLSPEEVAEVLNLNVRTIRRYIREGRLSATRIGKQYRIAAADFQAFVGREPQAQAAVPSRSRRVIVATTVDVHAISPSDGDRVAAMLSGAFSAGHGRSGARLESIYYAEQAVLRVVINADLGFTSAVLGLIDTVLENGPSRASDELGP